jgi:3-phenylpropionate/cinnamic acid dioxygenase small subunit
MWMNALDTLFAEREIGRILASYAHYADDGDADSFSALFADDGVLLVGEERLEGPEAVAAWLPTTLGKPLRHLMMNILIDVEDEEAASGSLDVLLLRKGSAGWHIFGTLRYTDRYVRAAGTWKIAQRTATLR